jgi:hypothetical protein
MNADDEGENHATDASAKRPGRDQFGPLMDRLGDRGGQRAVRDVHQGVDQPEDRVGGVGVDDLHAAVEAGRHVEDQVAHEEQRDGTEHDERTELAPPGHRPVDQTAGQ